MRKQLEVNGVQRDVPWSIVMHPNQMYALLNEAPGTTFRPVVASADYNVVRTLVGGMMNDGFMGFDNWRMTTEIDNEAVVGGSSYVSLTRNVYAFSRDAAVCGFNSDVDVRFDERWDRGHILQVAHYLDANATRVMGAKIASCGCFD